MWILKINSTYKFNNVFYTKEEWKDIKIEKERILNLIEQVDNEYKYDHNGKPIGTRFSIKISSFIKNNLDKKYFKYYKSSKLLGLKWWGLKRFYEIIEFQRNGKTEKTYKYNTTSQMIPLKSNRMNKKYIKGYAQRLKELWYIKNFECLWDKIHIEFLWTEHTITNENLQELRKVLSIFIEMSWLTDKQIIEKVSPHDIKKIILAKEYTLQQRRDKRNTAQEIRNPTAYFFRMLESDEIPKTRERLRKEREQ